MSREDIVAAFRAAMIGHFRSHVPGTNINQATLLASDYLNHFHELVMLLEAVASDPQGFSEDLLAWKPITYEEHFTSSGFRDKNLAIAAYHRAPPKIRARFDEAVARLHREAALFVGDVTVRLNGRNQRRLQEACEGAGKRLRVLIAEANSIATGEERSAAGGGDVSGPVDQAAVDTVFGSR